MLAALGFLGSKFSSKKQRKNFIKADRDKRLCKQKGKCDKCKSRLKPFAYQFDHKNGDRSNNILRNCQVLCSNCHDMKSRREQQNKKLQNKLRLKWPLILSVFLFLLLLF